MPEIIKLDFKFYLVRNKEGKFFRAKGYGGYGETWVEDSKKASVYQKLGTARSQVSFFANTFPQYGVPDIVEISASEGVILDETERVEKAKKSKALKNAQKMARYLDNQRAVLVAKRTKIQAELDKLSKG